MDEGKEKYGPRIVWVVRLPTMLSIYQPPPPSMKAPTAPSEGPFNYCFAKNAAAAPLLVVIFLARPSIGFHELSGVEDMSTVKIRSYFRMTGDHPVVWR